MVDAVVRRPEIIYAEESDILRVQFEEKPSVQSVEVAEGIVLDYDEEGRAVAIEIDGAGLLLRDFRIRANAVFSSERYLDTFQKLLSFGSMFDGPQSAATRVPTGLEAMLLQCERRDPAEGVAQALKFGFPEAAQDDLAHTLFSIPPALCFPLRKQVVGYLQGDSTQKLEKKRVTLLLDTYIHSIYQSRSEDENSSLQKVMSEALKQHVL